MLSIPLTGKRGKPLYKDVMIDYSTRWQNNFWRTIESAYRNSPYFEHYSDDLKKIIYSGTISIFDFNLQVLSFCLKSLQWSRELSETSQYQNETTDPVFDLRSTITTRNTYINRGFYRPAAYYQVFGSGFDENLSVLDLLFCTGPDAGRTLEGSRIRLNN